MNSSKSVYRSIGLFVVTFLVCIPLTALMSALVALITSDYELTWRKIIIMALGVAIGSSLKTVYDWYKMSRRRRSRQTVDLRKPSN